MEFKQFEGKTVKQVVLVNFKLHISFEETDEIMVVTSESFPHTGVEIGVKKSFTIPLSFFCEDCKEVIEPGENCPLKRRGRLTPCHTKTEHPI